MDGSGGTTIIYDVNLAPVESLLTEQNDLIRDGFEQLHGDASVLIASIWLLCGVVLGAAVGILIYKLWRS